MAALTREEADSFGDRRAASIATMTRERAVAALDAYHAAAEACRGLYTRPDAEREPLARALDRTRTGLLEAGRAPWLGAAGSPQ